MDHTRISTKSSHTVKYISVQCFWDKKKEKYFLSQNEGKFSLYFSNVLMLFPMCLQNAQMENMNYIK